MIPNRYLEKVYSGFLGMNIGKRLGGPVEPTVWTSERIERIFGDISGYIKEFRNFGADDDANGPAYFIRALYDKAEDHKLTSQDVADAWLNYTREGIGMFWWGGYGVSTEHTAYLNLKSGIPANLSGSAKTNGIILAEQIGGQIFIDTWGLVLPGNIKKAADYAETAARVSHDVNGIYGARFIAASISAAFYTSDVERIIEAGLSQIPEDSKYSQVVNAVCEFYKNNPEDFHTCLRYLKENWGYDRYPGVCHIIPNAGVCVLSMLYGREFARSVEIATMCGWDTDCNASNVGTIMGVACGIKGITKSYRIPINDGIVLSGISGYLNILDIPTFVRELASLGYQLANEAVPTMLMNNAQKGSVYFDFELDGSTHNFRLSNTRNCSLNNSRNRAYSGEGSLMVLFDQMARGQNCKIYYKPFYRREDFDDERYMPVFSPTAYPGQKVSMMVYVERLSGESIILSPYVRNTSTKEDIIINGKIIKEDGWNNISFMIPDMDGSMVDEIGILLEANSPEKNKDSGCLYIDDFMITGKANYTIDISKQKKEFSSITPFSHNHGAWNLEGRYMTAMCLEHAEAMTGNYYMKDVKVRGCIIPHTGYSHLISVMVQGALRGYYGGLTPDGVAIFINNKGMKRLSIHPMKWEYDHEYIVELTALGEKISLSIDGKELICVNDSSFGYGMAGYAMYSFGRCSFGNLSIQEL